MAVELKIPQSGESITEVQLGEWLKQEGDYVEADEVIVEIETDKATMELPAPTAGTLTRIRIPTGEVANIGDVVAEIDETADRPSGGAPAPAPRTTATSETSQTEAAPSSTATADAPVRQPHVMPAAQRVMAEHNLDRSQVKPSGPGNRITKADAERAAEAGAAQPSAPARPAAPTSGDNGAAEEVVPMTMLRRRIAERLVESQKNAAILTTINEIDMTSVMALRKSRQDAFVERYGIKLGFMSFFVKAAIDALKLVPAVNAEIRGTDIVYKNFFDIGVAVSTDRGLVVPVVRGADQLGFAEVELAINDLATRARDKKLDVSELQGGTFTISNGGVFGSLLSTPIINPPQVGILGLHSIQQRPVAIDGKVEIRPMMYVALSYDHRIIDGKESVTFLKRIKECVEDPTRMLIEV